MRKILCLAGLILMLGMAANFCSAEVTWEPDVRLTNDPEHRSGLSSDRSVATDSQNRVHVAWDAGGIYYKRSVDRGQTWENDIRLTDSIHSATPSITTDSQNRVHVVWMDSRDDNWEIYYKRGTQELKPTLFKSRRE